MQSFWEFVVVGFAAQLVDGTLGMAYGLSATSLLLSIGASPAMASATVHAAEVFTTGASSLAHHHFGNVDRPLFRRLVIPGVLGAVAGATVLSALPGERWRPYVAAYLLVMGGVVVFKAFRTFPPRRITRHLVPLGFVGALLDAIGGGGWGPIVASNLIARGGDPRKTVGTVNAVEFFVTLAASVTFVLNLGLVFWKMIAGLALGGVLAAPLGAYLCRRLPLRPLMVLVGLVIMGLSARNLWLP